MNKKNLSLFITFMLLLAIVGQAWLAMPLLSDKVITHFGFSGKGDSWSSKESFFLMQILFSFFIFLLMGGISLFLNKLPNSALNIPNKEYWLSPERRESTIEAFSFYLNIISSATLLFFFFIFREMIEINIHEKNSLGPTFWISLLSFMVFTLAITIRILTLFSSTSVEKDKRSEKN